MIIDFINSSLWLIFLAGAVGAFVSDILEDNCIILPRRVENVFNLGFAGSVLIGGIAGIFIDGSFVTAFMGGFMGKSVIKNLVSKNPPNNLGGGAVLATG